MARNVHPNLPLDKAQLIAFFLEDILFGISTLLYVITIWFLIYGRKTTHLNKKLVATSSLMMFFSILHISVDFLRILEGFITHQHQHGGPIGYFSRLSEWSFLFKTTIFIVQTVLADAFATYRSFIVWKRIWAAVVPLTFVIATLATGIGVVYNCAIIQPGQDVFASTLTGWITAFFTFTLATNLCCTMLIASRIFFALKEVAQFASQQTLLPVVIVIIESGTIYSMSCITILVFYLMDSNAQYPAIDGIFPIISIVFNLIIVRIALGLSQGDTSLTTMQNTPSEFFDTSHVQSQYSQFPMHPLNFTVTQLIHQDRCDVESGKRSPVKDDAESFMEQKDCQPGHGM